MERIILMAGELWHYWVNSFLVNSSISKISLQGTLDHLVHAPNEKLDPPICQMDFLCCIITEELIIPFTLQIRASYLNRREDTCRSILSTGKGKGNQSFNDEECQHQLWLQGRQWKHTWKQVKLVTKSHNHISDFIKYALNDNS